MYDGIGGKIRVGSSGIFFALHENHYRLGKLLSFIFFLPLDTSMCVIFILSGKCFLVYLFFWSRFKDVELYFYFVFRSDPKLFTDDSDIKYCKALNCCKLPKVWAQIHFVPVRRQISLLILFLIHDWNVWPVDNSRFGLQFVWRTTCVCKFRGFRIPLAKEVDCCTQGPKFNFWLLKMQFRCFTVQLKNPIDYIHWVNNFLDMNKLRQRIHDMKEHPRSSKYTCFTATVIWIFFLIWQIKIMVN